MEWDLHLLRLINSQWHHPFFDWLFPLLRNTEVWVPLYLFLILFVVFNYPKNGWWWVLGAALVPVLGDMISSSFIKEHIFRLRPCNDPALAAWLRFPEGLYRPQSSSFTSSHATNHFGMAVFLFYTLKPAIGNKAWLFMVWAALIGYAQIYIGVHYPFDIIGGGLLGALIGYSIAFLFNKKKGLQ